MFVFVFPDVDALEAAKIRRLPYRYNPKK